MYRNFFKRLLDIIASFILLVFLLFPFMIIGIIIRAKLGGPVFFKQRRPGKNNRIFHMYKFRTMTNERDENGNLLPDKDRLTKLGKFLRKSSIDELPQIINILIGDMSFIGPRPKLIKDVIFMKNDECLIRQAVRPGISGWAQIHGRNESTWYQVLERDKYYVKHISFFLDVKIFFKTIGVILSQKGINTPGAATHFLYADVLLNDKKITKEEHKRLNAEAIEIEKDLNKVYVFGNKTKFSKDQLKKEPKIKKDKS